MTEALIDEFNLLRTILQSDDKLQIQSCKTYHQIYIKLHFDIRINFYIDRSLKTLTINNIEDLKISKLSSKNSLTYEQWISIRDYFNQLIQQSNSNTTIHSIIQLIQNKLSEFNDLSLNNRRIHNSNIVDKDDLTDTISDTSSYLIQGLYHYDQSNQKWTTLTSDELIDSMYIPKRCQFLTWNIFSSETIHSDQRYQDILKTLKSSLPDIICLQGVTIEFLRLLLNENWLKNHNYYILHNISQEILSGQLILMKNLRPQTFSISEYLIVRFNLNSKVTIDLINLHLSKSNEKYAEEFENLLKNLNTQNYIIIGDLNFGDYDLKQEDILQKHCYHIHDLWKEIYDIEENPGYTFKSSTNLRSNRYLLHKLPNLSYSIDQLNLTGHYALELILHFHLRTISSHTELVLLPINNIFSSIQTYSKQYINIFHSFFDLIDCEDDEENILLPLRLLLSQYQSFNIDKLPKQIKQLYQQCEFNDNSNLQLIEQIPAESIRYLYILQKQDNPKSFDIINQLPLGSVLQPIGLNSYEYISNDLVDFFKQMNLYQNERSFQEKHKKYDRLVKYFNGLFNENTLHCFSFTSYPYGSFRLGLHGDDLDIVCVLSKKNPIDNPTNFDEKFLQLKLNPIALNNYLINYLEKQIIKDFNHEIIDCRTIQALYPIISIIFNDQIRVEIFVQIILNEQDEENIIFNEIIHGVHDIERLITYVRFPPIFQHLLTFIRTWAQNVGLYGQVYGYLGGYSWALLCAYICHKYITSISSSFSLEQFSILVEKFFSTYSQFNWSRESISFYSHHSTSDYRGSMRILCPNSPYNNTSRSTINSTRDLIIQAFQTAQNKTLKNILQLSNYFPDRKIQSILQLRLSGATLNELNQWIGYMKSRLAHFLTDCENDCKLFVQPNTTIEIRNQLLERFYSIGFEQNEQILSHHRDFYYSLNKFLEQFQIYPYRNETMKISYTLMSIKHWYNERNNACI